MPVRRSPAVSSRGRGRHRGPSPPSSSLASAQEPPRPLPPGTQIEARVDDDGFFGSWFEATVVDFVPATTGPRRPGQYAVHFSHLASHDGRPVPVAASHVRPRPPPSSAPGLRVHDVVEAFDGAGWWSGIVVAPVPDPDAAAVTVTVAFPVTREVQAFPAHLVRRRLDYVAVGGGEWVPSLSVVAVQPKRGARVYKAGEKVEVLMEREAYGESWFPATVARAVDRLSYIVEYYLDLDGQQQEKEKATTEYLHFAYIRPAEYHRLRESKVRLGPGAAVEVQCDGAWSRGVVRRVVREGCEYEVGVNGEVVERLLTKAAEQVRPLCIWDAKHWRIATDDDKGQHNSRQQYASRKYPISPADAVSHDDEGLQHASVSETDATLSASFKSVASNRCLNSCSLLSDKNVLAGFPHRTLNTCSVSKNGLLCGSSGHSSPPDELMPNAGGETECFQDVEMVCSDGQHKTLVYGRNANETCDMLSTPEVREQNIATSLINQQIQERPFFVKTLCVKKGITKNRRGETHSKAHQGRNDAPEHVQIQLLGNRNFSSEQFLFASSASPECQTTSSQTLQVTGGTRCSSDAAGVNFNHLATKEGTGLLDKELAATINKICEGNITPDVCADTADTQVMESSCLINTPLQSPDRLVAQDGNQVDEGSILQNLQNVGSSVFTSNSILLSSFPSSGSSMASDLALSQISGHQVPFVKRSPAWRLMDMMDVFKEVPQQPHFHPLREFLPALREGMALGLMVTFASSVEDIRKSSIADSTAFLQEKISTLRHLEAHGFSVQFLRCRLIKLLQIKSDHSNYIAEREQLKAQLLEKTASLSQIDEQLEKKEQIIAELEEKLGRARWEAQKIKEEKECEDEEISRLNAADRSVEEACGAAELDFESVLAELRHMRLT